jgi:putative endonuclease
MRCSDCARTYYVYILTNRYNHVLYTGVTNDLHRRIKEHKMRIHPGSFTGRYNVNKLVWYESFHNIKDAIAREKQLKAGSRMKKIGLVESMNREWRELEVASPR